MDVTQITIPIYSPGLQRNQTEKSRDSKKTNLQKICRHNVRHTNLSNYRNHNVSYNIYSYMLQYIFFIVGWQMSTLLGPFVFCHFLSFLHTLAFRSKKSCVLFLLCKWGKEKKQKSISLSLSLILILSQEACLAPCRHSITDRRGGVQQTMWTSRCGLIRTDGIFTSLGRINVKSIIVKNKMWIPEHQISHPKPFQ